MAAGASSRGKGVGKGRGWRGRGRGRGGGERGGGGEVRRAGGLSPRHLHVLSAGGEQHISVRLHRGEGGDWAHGPAPPPGPLQGVHHQGGGGGVAEDVDGRAAGWSDEVEREAEAAAAILDLEEPPGLLPREQDQDDDDEEGLNDAVNVGEEEEAGEEQRVGEGEAEVGNDGGGEEHLAAGATPPLPPGVDLPSLEELFSALIPTVKHCPKAAKGEFARELATLWQKLAADSDDVRLWALMAMFAKVILPAGRGPRVGDAYSQARLVRERLRRWRGGEYLELWEEAKQLTKEARKPKRGKKKKNAEEEQSQQKKNAERAATLAQDGQYTKALQALTSAGMAPDTAATRAKLQAKHPAAPAPQIPATVMPQLTFSKEEVKKSVRKFRRGSAPGPSGLRPEHLQATLQAAPGRSDRALETLSSLVTALARGGVPQEVAPHFCGARLHAAVKKDGGIRPIAVGNILRRLVAKCCVVRLQSRAAALLSPHQLGVGVRGGCEAIVHTVRQAPDSDPSLWTGPCKQI